MVEGDGEACAARLADDLGAARIVGTHDPIVIEEIQIGRDERYVMYLEAVGLERAGLRTRQPPNVLHGHSLRHQVDAFPARVAAVAVAAREHLSVAIEGMLRGGGQIVEDPGANSLGCGLRHLSHGRILPFARI